jgi:hypothetical protein
VSLGTSPPRFVIESAKGYPKDGSEKRRCDLLPDVDPSRSIADWTLVKDSPQWLHDSIFDIPSRFPLSSHFFFSA